MARDARTDPAAPEGTRSIYLDWDLGLALLAYVAASTSDYLLTMAGLAGREVRELNPLLLSYMDALGASWGLMLPKLLLGCTAVLASSLYIHAMYRQRRTRIRAEYILYPGAIFTVLAPLQWIVLKYWVGFGG